MWAWGGRHNMPEHTRQRLPASPRPEAVGEAMKAEMAQPTNEKGAG